MTAVVPESAAGAPAAACDACLRRTMLVASLAGGIEIARHRRRPLREVLALGDAELAAAVAGDRVPEVLEEVAARSVTALRDAAGKAGLLAICRHDPAYPAMLRDDRSAAAVLFARAGGAGAAARLGALLGRPGEAPPPAVAIVGTRKASPEGLEVARTLGRGLAAAGVTVVSGMALGIDGAAHAGALEGGGTTVAVLAGGADIAYPATKRRLYGAIVGAGLVISEMPPGFRAHRWCFPARNRTIAALAPATLVVEAAERSGSLITAELALDLGRDVGAVPGPVMVWRSRGTNALLRDGATLIRDAADALDLVLGVGEAEAATARAALAVVAPPADLEPSLRALLRAIEDGRDTVGALAADPGAAAAVRAGLMELELLGLVRRGPGGRVVRVPAAGGWR
ncbi:DNA-protecting protein DprA [Baekduia soli]|uniref:DNA-protecting protein DprA n=1 Tax=Baekduia soli TaxID=496014 RepID=A0A5B8U6G7_9ACTN|nr:DNA-processing protein DprA [Baekduia soli]QEC48684.1 DNA-protecting protein DprA [Baekduia soli]